MQGYYVREGHQGKILIRSHLSRKLKAVTDQTIWLSKTSAFQAEETANAGTKRQEMLGMF